jgi:hypothetical protein
MRWAYLAYLAGFPVWLTVLVILLQIRERLKSGGQPGLIEGTWAFLRGLVINPTGLMLGALALAFAFGFPMAYRIGFDLRTRKTSCEYASLERRQARTLFRLWTWIWPVLLAGTLVGLAFPSSRTMAVGTLGAFGLKLSVPLLILGLKSRVGTFLTCARCGYRMSSWRRAKDPCPECGNLWKQPWGAALGVPGIRWRLVAIGAVLQLASLLAMVWLVWRLR